MLENNDKTNFDDYVYNQLKEAENEMNNTTLRYNSEEVFNSMKDIANNGETKIFETY